MKLTQTLAASTLALSAGLWSSLSAADNTPVAEAHLIDAQRTALRFDDSLYGKLWNDPALGVMRKQIEDKWDEICQEALAEDGINPAVVLQAVRDAGIRFYDADVLEQSVDLQAQVQLTEELVTTFLAKLKKEGGSDAAIAGASDSVGSPDGKFAAGRFGNYFVIGNTERVGAPWSAVDHDADIIGHYNSIKAQKLITAITEAMGQPSMTMPAEWDLPNYNISLKLVEEGTYERWESDGPVPDQLNVGRAIDMDLVARLPANTLLMGAAGLEGKKYVHLLKTFLAPVLEQQGQSYEDTMAMVNAQLQMVGLSFTVEQFVEGLNGTFLLGLCPSMPFPSGNIAMPRSAEMDELLTFGLGMIGQTAPEVGASSSIRIPNMPLPISLARDDNYWWISTDPILTSTWLKGGDNGFTSSAAGKLAVSQMDSYAQTTFMGTSNTPDVLRLALGFGSMAFSQLPPSQAQQLTTFLQRLSETCSTGYVIGGLRADNSMLMEARGILGFTPMLVVPAGAVAAYSVKQQFAQATSYNQAKESANASMAQTQLKAGTFPAQASFQAGAYTDTDGDGVGEYGFLNELSGGVQVGTGITLTLLPESFQGESPVIIDGMKFQTFLPGSASSGITDPAGATTANADLREKHFVVYAWPADEGSDGKMYAITENGQVFQTDFWGIAPTWNELFGGGTWGDQALWDKIR